MKTTVLLLLLTCVSITHAQMYYRTKKNIGIYMGGAIGSNQESNTSSMWGGAAGLTHMISPGIYPKIGWSYNLFSTMEPRSETRIKSAQQSMDASILFDKRILKLVDGKRINYSCHYLSIGIIGAPEFHFFLNKQPSNPNYSISAMLGLSFTHICTNKGKASFTKTKQLDLFMRRTFLPNSNSINTTTYYVPMEIGLQMRFLRHQVKSSVHS